MFKAIAGAAGLAILFAGGAIASTNSIDRVNSGSSTTPVYETLFDTVGHFTGEATLGKLGAAAPEAVAAGTPVDAAVKYGTISAGEAAELKAAGSNVVVDCSAESGAAQFNSVVAAANVTGLEALPCGAAQIGGNH